MFLSGIFNDILLAVVFADQIIIAVDIRDMQSEWKI